jgi:hypothetical protein
MGMASSVAKRKSTMTAFTGSDVRELVIQHNRLARMVAMQSMPGVLLSDPATKTGTTSAKKWRAEAFTFTFRGKITSAAAQEKAFESDTSHDVAASKEAWFVLTTRTDGTTFTITKGADQTIGTRLLPTNIDNEVVIGWLQIVTGSTGFDATTDDLAVAGTIIASLAFHDAEFVELVADESDAEVVA